MARRVLNNTGKNRFALETKGLFTVKERRIVDNWFVSLFDLGNDKRRRISHPCVRNNLIHRLKIGQIQRCQHFNSFFRLRILSVGQQKAREKRTTDHNQTKTNQANTSLVWHFSTRCWCRYLSATSFWLVGRKICAFVSSFTTRINAMRRDHFHRVSLSIWLDRVTDDTPGEREMECLVCWINLREKSDVYTWNLFCDANEVVLPFIPRKQKKKTKNSLRSTSKSPEILWRSLSLVLRWFISS